MARLRVATFNIQHGRGADGRVDPARLARACASLDADILGLQEVDVGVARSGGVDLVGEVADATGMHAAFHAVDTIGGGGYGNALLARSRLEEVERLSLPGAEGREPRGALLARVARVSVAVTHLSVGAALHRKQLARLVSALDERPVPRVLMGDLNHVAPLVPGYTLAGGDPTFPVVAPRVRIDHIATVGLEVASVEVVGLEVSDHRALVVTLSQ
jgi:endonuclease/exonuclease/phosphatase family metal-dependent hydrolase